MIYITEMYSYFINHIQAAGIAVQLLDCFCLAADLLQLVHRHFGTV